MQQPRWTWSTLAIVSATVVLVFGPVFIPREVSRWYLAAAANSYRVGDRNLGRDYLEKAIDWDGSIVGDRDFWIAQMDNTNSDEVLELLKKAIETDSRSAPMAQRIALIFIDEFDFQRALRALKMAFPDGQPWDAEDLNFLAYLRAQAGLELEQALKDIDRAIEVKGQDPGLLDTKAWVLHAMGKDLEALGFANDAIKKMDERIGLAKAKPSDKEKHAKQKTAQADKPSASSSKETAPAEAGPVEAGPVEAGPVEATEEPVGPLSQTEQIRKAIQAAKTRLGIDMWSLAVLRFHRLRICEALKRPVEAQQERDWLTEHGVPIVDELF